MYLLKRGITEGGQRRKRDSKSGHSGQRKVWWLQIGFLKKEEEETFKGWKESGQLKSSEEKRPSWAHMIFVKIVHSRNVQIMQKMRELQQTESPINIRQNQPTCITYKISHDEISCYSAWSKIGLCPKKHDVQKNTNLFPQ